MRAKQRTCEYFRVPVFTLKCVVSLLPHVECVIHTHSYFLCIHKHHTFFSTLVLVLNVWNQGVRAGIKRWQMQHVVVTGWESRHLHPHWSTGVWTDIPTCQSDHKLFILNVRLLSLLFFMIKTPLVENVFIKYNMNLLRPPSNQLCNKTFFFCSTVQSYKNVLTSRHRIVKLIDC